MIVRTIRSIPCQRVWHVGILANNAPRVLWNCTFDNAEVYTAIYGICEGVLGSASPVPILVVLWHDIPQSVNAKGNRGG